MVRKKVAPTLAGIAAGMRAQGLVLEDMRSQNRATIEAVQATRAALEQRIEHLEHELKGLARDSETRNSALGFALRELRLEVQENGVEVRGLSARIEALASIEKRVSAIEGRLG